MALKIMTCNMNSLGLATKRRKFFVYLCNRKVDIAMIQETYANKQKIKLWKNEWNRKIVSSNYSTSAREVTILFKNGLDFKLLKTETDKNGRMIKVVIEYNNQKILLVNLYAQNEEDSDFFKGIFDGIVNDKFDQLIIGGDFNKILDPILDKKSKIERQFKSKTTDLLNCILEEKDWVDVWRMGHPGQKQFT